MGLEGTPKMTHFGPLLDPSDPGFPYEAMDFGDSDPKWVRMDTQIG